MTFKTALFDIMFKGDVPLAVFPITIVGLGLIVGISALLGPADMDYSKICSNPNIKW